MSHNFTPQQIQERFQSLPLDIQNVIAGAETAQRIEDIGRARGLRIDAIGILIEYSGLIMLGLIKSKEFVDHLSRQLSISKEQAESIAVDVDTQVFSRIRNSLRDVQYRSTTDERFEAVDDFDSSPARDSQSDDTKQGANYKAPDQEFSSPTIGSSMSGADYDPNSFASGEATTIAAHPKTSTDNHTYNQREFTGQNKILTADIEYPAEATDNFTDLSDIHPGGGVNIPISVNQTDTVAPYTTNENQAYNQAAQSVIDKMPGAIRDAYATKQSAAPRADVPHTAIVDFKTRLEEKMAQGNNVVVNNDPYKESI